MIKDSQQKKKKKLKSTTPVKKTDIVQTQVKRQTIAPPTTDPEVKNSKQSKVTVPIDMEECTFKPQLNKSAPKYKKQSTLQSKEEG